MYFNGYSTVVLFFTSFIQTIHTNCTTLKQIHVIFRHGERSPSLVYPNDPYKSVWSDNLGHLSNKGKLEMHTLGGRLRQKYSCYLSNQNISPIDVKISSSYSDRCLMSAQLYNSGFLIPQNEQIWNPDLLWQPIPISYKPRDNDNMIAAKQKCKKYDNAYSELFQTAKYKEILKENIEMFKYLTEHTGMNIDTIRKVEELYNTLEIEQLQNFSLPKWTEKYYPSKMKSIASLCLSSFTETEFMKRMKGGPLLKKVISDMNKILRNGKYTKIFIYSGHDVTLVNILRTLGFTNILKPNFASYLIMELHDSPSSQVKFYYSDCGWCEEKELKLENRKNVTLKQFEEAMKPVIPEDWLKECDSEI